MEQEQTNYWNAIEPIWDLVNIYDGGERFLSSITPLNRPTVLLFAAHFCLSELHNGGFLQFFWNSTGVLGPEAIEGFKLIGMPKLASVVEQAGIPLGPTYPRDREARWDAMIAASGLDGSEIEKIFSSSKTLYLAYAATTGSLGWDTLNRNAWELADTENGGFDIMANRYVSTHQLLPGK